MSLNTFLPATAENLIIFSASPNPIDFFGFAENLIDFFGFAEKPHRFFSASPKPHIQKPNRFFFRLKNLIDFLLGY